MPSEAIDDIIVSDYEAIKLANRFKGDSGDEVYMGVQKLVLF